jgi:hypothetical protein
LNYQNWEQRDQSDARQKISAFDEYISNTQGLRDIQSLDASRFWHGDSGVTFMW